MKKIITNNVAKLFFTAACLFLGLLMAGCNTKDDVISVYDPSYIGQNPQPVVDSIGAINGLSAQLAGLGQLRIYGKNFSADPTKNIVSFNEQLGTILASTASTIDVQVPYYPSDSLIVRVSVQKAIQYSNTKKIQLKDPAIPVYSTKKSTSNPTPYIIKTAAFDKLGTLYLCYVKAADLGKMGISKYDPETKTFSDWFAASAMPVSNWNQMRFGPDGLLYCAGAQRRIATIPAAGGSASPGSFATFPSTDGVLSLNDFDFDAADNIWTGGNITSNKIYSVDRSKVITSFAFTGLVHAMRVFEGNLYIAALRGTSEKIYKLKINSSTSLGAEEVYFDLGAKYPTAAVTSLEFAKDGNMYVGLDKTPGMLMIAPGGAASEEYYPPVLQPAGTMDNSLKYSAFKWSADNFLYIALERATSTTDSELKLLKINTLRTAAPDYGIQ